MPDSWPGSTPCRNTSDARAVWAAPLEAGRNVASTVALPRLRGSPLASLAAWSQEACRPPRRRLSAGANRAFELRATGLGARAGGGTGEHGDAPETSLVDDGVLLRRGRGVGMSKWPWPAVRLGHDARTGS